MIIESLSFDNGSHANCMLQVYIITAVFAEFHVSCYGLKFKVINSMKLSKISLASLYTDWR